MPLTGPIPEGRTFFCPHCGALYSVTYSRLSKSDSDIAKCVVCLQIMTSWDSTKVPIYKLVQRPDDALPPPQAPPRSRPARQADDRYCLTDGQKAYLEAVEGAFGSDID